jgi:hypothetical protein
MTCHFRKPKWRINKPMQIKLTFVQLFRGVFKFMNEALKPTTK